MTIKRKFSPVRSDNRLIYEIDGDVITVKHLLHQEPTEDGEGNITPVDPIITEDVFDFTEYPNGAADVSTIETVLPVNPFLSVKRVEGILEIVVINYHGANATDKERFPKWEVLISE